MSPLRPRLLRWPVVLALPCSPGKYKVNASSVLGVGGLHPSGLRSRRRDARHFRQEGCEFSCKTRGRRVEDVVLRGTCAKDVLSTRT
eukprot:6577570-Lingulodinium_polyedra.AAC.1